MEAAMGFRNLGTAESTTCAGNAAKHVLATPEAAGERRSGFTFKNHHATSHIWLYLVQRGASAPTISSTANHFDVAPGQTITVGASETVAIYAENDQAGAGTANYTAQNYSY